ncbi:hypothetical protein ScalyP_jg109, partial [Parmales sp. scaly parma]
MHVNLKTSYDSENRYSDLTNRIKEREEHEHNLELPDEYNGKNYDIRTGNRDLQEAELSTSFSHSTVGSHGHSYNDNAGRSYPQSYRSGSLSSYGSYSMSMSSSYGGDSISYHESMDSYSASASYKDDSFRLSGSYGGDSISYHGSSTEYSASTQDSYKASDSASY